TLYPDAFPVDDAHLPQAFLTAGFEVGFQHIDHLSGLERMQIQYPVDLKFHGFIPEKFIRLRHASSRFGGPSDSSSSSPSSLSASSGSGSSTICRGVSMRSRVGIGFSVPALSFLNLRMRGSKRRSVEAS